MAKTLYMVGNWKSNKTLEEAKKWIQKYSCQVKDARVKNVICPPFPYINSLEFPLEVELGAQDVSPFPFGAYTGAVSAAMVSVAVKYAIVGHSERREYFHETHQEVANKAAECMSSQITPIVCIDSPYLKDQITALDPEIYNNLIVAYEPLSAIGSGDPDTPEHADEVSRRVKELTDNSVPVLYGGSVSAGNVADFVSMPNIDGVLVGGKSLDPVEWSDLVQVAYSTITE